MNILNPLGLLGLLALMPVIALYFLKLKRAPLVVSSTMLWRKALDDRQVTSPFQRLKVSLLLILQLVFLALLAFALTRPFSAGGFSGKMTVLLFDTSAGMGTMDAGRDGKSTRLAAAVAEARSRVDDLGPNDTLAVVAFDTEVRRLAAFTRDPAVLHAALDALSPRDVGGSAEEAVETARAMCAGHSGASWVILSDGGFERVRLEAETAAGRFLRFGKDTTDNVGITAVSCRGRPVRVQGADGRMTDAVEMQLFLRVENFSQQPQDAVLRVMTETERFPAKTVRLAARPKRDLFDEEILGGRTVNPAEEAVSTEIFQLPIGIRGVVTARLEAPKDNFPADDEVSVVISAEERFRVLYVGEGNWFLERAILGIPEASLDKRTPVEHQEAWARDGEGATAAFDVLIFDHCAPPAPPSGGLLYISAVPSLPGFGAKKEKALWPRVVDWDNLGVLLRYVNFGLIMIESSLIVNAPKGAQTLVDSDAGPLILSWHDERRRVVSIGFDLLHSDWPYRGSFPLFFRNVIQWLGRAGFRHGAVSWTSGKPLILPPDDAVIEVSLRRPLRPVAGGGKFGEMGDVQKINLSPTEATHLRDVFAVGLYRFDGLKPPHKERIFAVNLADRNESDNAARGSIDVGGKKLEGEAVLWSGKRDLWPWLVWPALILVILEWLIFHQKRRAKPMARKPSFVRSSKFAQ